MLMRSVTNSRRLCVKFEMPGGEHDPQERRVPSSVAPDNVPRPTQAITTGVPREESRGQSPVRSA